MITDKKKWKRLDKIKLRIDADNDNYRELIEIIEELEAKNEILKKLNF